MCPFDLRLPFLQILVKDFLARKEKGELKLDAYNRRLARGLQQVRNGYSRRFCPAPRDRFSAVILLTYTLDVYAPRSS